MLLNLILSNTSRQSENTRKQSPRVDFSPRGTMGNVALRRNSQRGGRQTREIVPGEPKGACRKGVVRRAPPVSGDSAARPLGGLRGLMWGQLACSGTRRLGVRRPWAAPGGPGCTCLREAPSGPEWSPEWSWNQPSVSRELVRNAHSRPHRGLLSREPWGWGPEICFDKPTRRSDGHRVGRPLARAVMVTNSSDPHRCRLPTWAPLTVSKWVVTRQSVLPGQKPRLREVRYAVTTRHDPGLLDTSVLSQATSPARLQGTTWVLL